MGSLEDRDRGSWVEEEEEITNCIFRALLPVLLSGISVCCPCHLFICRANSVSRASSSEPFLSCLFIFKIATEASRTKKNKNKGA
ncbi:hypothetical protein RchiOBHm_Chr6g0254261 [Rosa chinensis]|uniref:Uncharacterized protein n=1 Tax=Rosa chinensis TaxID=74649 RepID=A0A2P6PLL9_ROSCH|nr:hypothetical protein RchiOBHm_Chr6g0254261 [Rosa chinensis]